MNNTPNENQISYVCCELCYDRSHGDEGFCNASKCPCHTVESKEEKSVCCNAKKHFNEAGYVCAKCGNGWIPFGSKSSTPPQVDKGRQREEKCCCGEVEQLGDGRCELAGVSHGRTPCYYIESIPNKEVKECPHGIVDSKWCEDLQEVKEWDWEKEWNRKFFPANKNRPGYYTWNNPEPEEIEEFIKLVHTSTIRERDAEIVELCRNKMYTDEENEGLTEETIMLRVSHNQALDLIINSLSKKDI